MKARQVWLSLKGSLWFIPGIMVAGAILLAIGLIELSASVDNETYARMPRLFGAGADGARGMLSTIAGSVITVAGVTFSLTIAALAQASAQYTPRVLRTFMGDRSSQVVLGTFVGVFTYCLVVLRTIRGGDEGAFVPAIAVLGGFVLAIVGVGVLVFFIHHTASGLQASTILARVRRATEAAIDDVFPDELGPADADDVDADAELPGDEAARRPIASRRTGYVQSIDPAALRELAVRDGVRIHVRQPVGSFAIRGDPLVLIEGDGHAPHGTAPRIVNDELARQINDAFTINSHRTVEQDPSFGILQIVDIALKALSPGINDITTAVNAIDHILALMVKLACRRIGPMVSSARGNDHVQGMDMTFEQLLSLAFDDVRRNAGNHVTVLARLIDAVEVVANHTRAPSRRRLLARHLDLLGEAIDGGEIADSDRRWLTGRLAAARDAITVGEYRAGPRSLVPVA